MIQSELRRLAKSSSLWMLLSVIGGLSMGTFAAEPHPQRGLYAIWYSSKSEVLDLSYIVGGQVVRQWADLAPSPGQFDFAPLDEALSRLHARGFPATIQINGNQKPGWLFDRVPYHPEHLSHQVRDETGSLMYWHPAHREAYYALLQAFGEYLETTPYRNSILGIRLNFNALGTEHIPVVPEQRPLDRWIIPPGVKEATEWTPEIGEAYRADVVSWFVELLSDKTRVFVRNNLSDELREPFLNLFETGRLCWFHTSTEAQPRNAGNERKYQTFIDYCRSGKTLAYAECWASAWGHHGGLTDPRFCSPPQWNYWRLLCDLHCGVSFIAAYSNDLEVALDGKYLGQAYSEYKDEFDKAFRFASRYAGYHASPAQSPGAWVAFREGDFLKGDYTFLIERLSDNTRPSVSVGPEVQRYGAWARVLPAGSVMRLEADSDFVASLPDSGSSVNLVYLDEEVGSISLQIGDVRHAIEKTGTGRWKIATFSLRGKNLRSGNDRGLVTLEAQGNPATLHRVEILRSGEPIE